MRAGYCRFEHADQIRSFPAPPPRQPHSCRFTSKGGEAAMTAGKKNTSKDAASGSPAASSEPGGGGAEVAGERVEVVTYAASLEIAPIKVAASIAPLVDIRPIPRSVLAEPHQSDSRERRPVVRSIYHFPTVRATSAA